MSAQMLRDGARTRIRHQIEDHMILLKDQVEAPMDRLRYLQGVVQGLEIAESQLTDEYRKLTS